MLLSQPGGLKSETTRSFLLAGLKGGLRSTHDSRMVWTASGELHGYLYRESAEASRSQP